MNNTRTIKHFKAATNALKRTEAALIELAKQQIELIVKVHEDLGIIANIARAGYRYYDWIEIKDVTLDGQFTVECQLWTHANYMNEFNHETSFILSKHIINGQPEKFVEELTAKLQPVAEAKKANDRLVKLSKIEQLEKQLEELKK